MPDREKVMLGLECCLKAESSDDCVECPYFYGKTDCVRQKNTDALALLKEQEARWIPVTERLPENGEYVLAYSADDGFATVEARHKFEVFQITHWMPLPEPPKEEDYAEKM